MNQTYPFSVPSGVNIIYEGSGVTNIGSVDKPVAAVYTNTVLSKTLNVGNGNTVDSTTMSIVGGTGSTVNASATNSIAVGNGVTCDGYESAVFGYGTNATATRSLVYGYQNTAYANADASLVGGGTCHAYSGAVNSIALGAWCDTFAPNTVAIGTSNKASGTSSTALGYGANALHTNSMVLSANSATTSTANNQLTLGFSGAIVLTSGTDLLPAVSGIGNIGSSSMPFNSLNVSESMFIPTVIPASGAATGIFGQMAIGVSGLYICTATDTWVLISGVTF